MTPGLRSLGRAFPGEWGERAVRPSDYLIPSFAAMNLMRSTHRAA